ncbi:peptidoglycan-binding domain-containing protein [Flavobacterium davisii]|uniref:Peptidoglycan-binding protein n=1 Tax=Flavobacterium columnare TaxID=996 RepID=A0A8G0KYF2_9FLAO|nr:peptidoglycan-binding domain-containing protein [Flavobacterium davisii]QYS89555.1 peptidoglycan-binding protein [Flavobacterium davisii]
MKKGISVISGVTSPTVGEKMTYHISEWYPNTPLSEREKANVTWELFKKRSDGRFTTTHVKKKGDSSFTFGESSAGETYRLEAYLYQPEGGGLIITPKASRIPKICKVDLTYVDDSKGSVFSFTEKLRAKAHCVNMFNKEILFTLWEDDAKGSGHNASNKLIDTKKAKVDLYGNVVVDFMLTKALMKKAMQGEADIRELEFYVTVEYYRNKKHTTANVDIQNPLPTENTPPSQSTGIKKAKGSPAEEKPKSKKEESGLLTPISETLGEIWDWVETQGTALRDKPHTIEIPEGKSPAIVGKTKSEKASTTGTSCGERYCLKKGDKSELIREINIRLAGFGGNVPTDEFTDRTEKMIKQFQRDYMKVPETGKVCGNVLLAIDQFQVKYNFDFSSLKCKCGKCSGFGDNSNKEKYLKGNLEAHHRYEYPGIHRSLLWSLRSVLFYLEKEGKYTFDKISSGYRCRNHEEYLKKPTTNHMGKALDLHFNKNGARTRIVSDIEKIRSDIFNKYLGAKWDWKNEKDIFYLESTSVGATTWIHYDVREFTPTKYLLDKYFAKTLNDFNGKGIVQLAKELGFQNTCNCIATLETATPKNETKKEGCFCGRDFTTEDLVSLGISKKMQINF